MPNSDFTKAINAVDLPGLVADLYPESGSAAGRSVTAKAVWRDEENPSFSIYRNKNQVWMYKDQATGETGNAWHFLTDILGWPSPKAYDEIMERAGDYQNASDAIGSTSDEPQPCAKVPVQEGFRKELAEKFRRTLREGTIPPDIERRGFTLEDVKALGIANDNGDALLPILSPEGTLLNIKRRKLNPQHKGDRYRGMSGHGSPAWCSPKFSENEEVLIVEGELNAMAVYVAFAKEAGISVMGVAGATMDLHLDALKNKVVYVYADNDRAGLGAQERWLRESLWAGAKSAHYLDALDEDACDLMEEGGKESVRIVYKKLFENAQQIHQDEADTSVEEALSPDLKRLFGPPMTEVGNLERLLILHGDKIRFLTGNGFIIWDGRRWALDEDESVLTTLIIETTRTLRDAAELLSDSSEKKIWVKHAALGEKQSAIRAVIKLAQATPQIRVRSDDMDKEKYLLNVRNGVIDLRTGDIFPHSPQYFMTKIVDIEYDPQAKAPLWEEFQRTITKDDEELLSFKKRALGYSLTGDTSEECLFVCYGSGANGKSTEQNIIRRVLGGYGRATQFNTFSLKQNEGPRSDVARLQGARYVSASEGSSTHQLDEGLVKQATGSDPIVARFLYQKEFQFYPVWKIWLATNHKPTIRGVDEGIWRRVKLIPYTVTIPPEERDKGLAEKLQKEISGVLAWMVEGCRDWYKLGLGRSAAVDNAVDEYRDESDMLLDFITNFVELGQDYTVTARELYDAYRIWAKNSGEYVHSMRKFSLFLTERGFEREKAWIDGKTISVRRGLRLNHRSEALMAGLSVNDDLMESKKRASA